MQTLLYPPPQIGTTHPMQAPTEHPITASSETNASAWRRAASAASAFIITVEGFVEELIFPAISLAGLLCWIYGMIWPKKKKSE